MEDASAHRLSTRYLVAMISFVAGVLVTTDALRFVLAKGIATAPLVKLAVCVGLLTLTAVVINNNDYFANRQQYQLLKHLRLSGPQAVAALAVLAFWIALKVAFFGTHQRSHDVEPEGRAGRQDCLALPRKRVAPGEGVHPLLGMERAVDPWDASGFVAEAWVKEVAAYAALPLSLLMFIPVLLDRHPSTRCARIVFSRDSRCTWSFSRSHTPFPGSGLPWATHHWSRAFSAWTLPGSTRWHGRAMAAGGGASATISSGFKEGDVLVARGKRSAFGTVLLEASLAESCRP